MATRKLSLALFAVLTLPNLSLTPVPQLGVATAHAELELPKPSPKASVSQRIGLTDVTVDYSSPAVNKRPIWGALVPYGKVWRAGANECTKVSFSKDVLLNGKKLAGGEYCFAAIPGKEEWTAIFHREAKLWGAYGYDQKNDVLRVPVKPVAVPHRERLTYLFQNVAKDRGELRLEWETLALPLTVEADTRPQALANIQSLSSNAWLDYAQAARYLLEDEQNASEALKYADRSIGFEKTWFNTWVKAQVLAEQGQRAEALKLAGEAKALGDGSEFFKALEPQISKALSDWGSAS